MRNQKLTPTQEEKYVPDFWPTVVVVQKDSNMIDCPLCEGRHPNHIECQRNDQHDQGVIP